MGVPSQNTIDLKISTQNTIDLKSCTNNDKDLTHNISNKNINHKFPDYVKPFLKQYICLLGLNDNFGHIHKYLDYENIKKGDLKKQEKFLQSLCFFIGKYGEAVKSGFFKDLSEEELTLDVFDNIDDIEKTIDEYLENYLVPCTEDDDEYEYDDCNYKLDKQKYENNVDKDYPGLKKLIDTLKLYYETIKYEKIYNLPESKKTIRSNINYSSESEDESDNFPERETIRNNLTYSDFEDESESEIELSNEDIQDILNYIANEDEEIIAYNYDSDIGASDISDFDSDSDSD